MVNRISDGIENNRGLTQLMFAVMMTVLMSIASYLVVDKLSAIDNSLQNIEAYQKQQIVINEELKSELKITKLKVEANSEQIKKNSKDIENLKGF